MVTKRNQKKKRVRNESSKKKKIKKSLRCNEHGILQFHVIEFVQLFLFMSDFFMKRVTELETSWLLFCVYIYMNNYWERVLLGEYIQFALFWPPVRDTNF